MTSPNLEYLLPTATVFQPSQNVDHFFTVTDGNKRSDTTAPLPKGTYLVTVDWNIPYGEINARIRQALFNVATFPISQTKMRGVGSLSTRMISNDANGWFTINGSATSDAMERGIVTVTITPTAVI